MILQRGNYMSRASFFTGSRPLKYASICGLVGFAAGAAASAALALRIEALCTLAVSSFVGAMSQNLTISEINAVVTVGGSSFTITLEDINAALPNNWLTMINHAEDLPPYCYDAPLSIGLCITLVAALALAALVAVAISECEKAEEARLRASALSMSPPYRRDAFSL